LNMAFSPEQRENIVHSLFLSQGRQRISDIAIFSIFWRDILSQILRMRVAFSAKTAAQQATRLTPSRQSSLPAGSPGGPYGPRAPCCGSR
jgi:hypothetical protein